MKFPLSSSSITATGGREKEREKEKNSYNVLLDLSAIGVDGLKKSKRTYGDGKYFPQFSKFFFLNFFFIVIFLSHMWTFLLFLFLFFSIITVFFF